MKPQIIKSGNSIAVCIPIGMTGLQYAKWLDKNRKAIAKAKELVKQDKPLTEANDLIDTKEADEIEGDRFMQG